MPPNENEFRPVRGRELSGFAASRSVCPQVTARLSSESVSQARCQTDNRACFLAGAGIIPDWLHGSVAETIERRLERPQTRIRATPNPLKLTPGHCGELRGSNCDLPLRLPPHKTIGLSIIVVDGFAKRRPGLVIQEYGTR